MLLDKKALSGYDYFRAKFLRVGNEIYIIGPNDEEINVHIELARKHKVLERVEDLRTQNPDQIDGGMIFVEGSVVRIGASSTSLSLPITDKARKITKEILKQEYPSFSIKEVSD